MTLPRLTAATTALTLLGLGLACSGGGAGSSTEISEKLTDPAAPSVEVADAPQDTDADSPAEAPTDSDDGKDPDDGEPSNHTEDSDDAEPSNEVTGSVQSLRGDTLRLELRGEGPAPGTAVQLQRRYLQNLFGADVTVNLNVGEAVVQEKRGDVLILSKLRTESVVTVDGKEQNQFEEGTDIVVTW